MDCLNCGKEVRNLNNIRYFCNPTPYIMLPCSYYLCDEHKDLRYLFEDIYEIKNDKPVRKEIDHDAISQRKSSKE